MSDLGTGAGLVLLLLALGGLLVIAIQHSVKTAELARVRWAEFQTSHPGWDIHLHASSSSLIALNHDLKRIALGTVAQYRTYDWSQIAAVEIIKDGASVTSTNRSS